MRVRLRNPDREVELDGPRSVREVLTELAIDPDTVRQRCAQPTTGRFCAFCRARAQVLGERLGPLADDQVARELAEEVLAVEVYGR